MKHILTVVARFMLVLIVTGLICAFMLFSPVLSCHGQGTGGNCGEGFLASLPITLLASPLILVGVAGFFSTFYPLVDTDDVDTDGVGERGADPFGCPVCGAYLDMRNPGQVLAHIHQAQVEIAESNEPPPRD
jgi:hypothetical protein